MKFVGVCRPGYGERLRQEWKEYVENNPPQNEDRMIDDDTQPNNNNINNTTERHFILIESETEDFSSTAVRDCIISGQFTKMEKMLHRDVAEDMRKKNYFNYAKVVKLTKAGEF